ncbi:MAG: T9SS C-terminal target domain-containing protein [Bacteroidetes bacterium]|nr:T9SS C-terminal target domain-containing protein [Bacteroidota bacterium]
MQSVLRIFITAMILFSLQDSFAVVDSTTLNSSNITGLVTLNRTTTYKMKGFNYVKNGGKIVIPEGTVIKGDFISKGTLIIERGGIIYANGTANNPIVFTSDRPAGSRAAGDWGGVIILGRSGINTSTGVDSAEIEGFGPGLGPIYGGQPRIDTDSSGCFRYVRIEFPGVNLTGISGNEINGLTMGGVGSRTVIEYVQVSYSGDDSYEWFGGTVNPNHLIAYKGLDDDWDCDNGFRGRVQFCLSIRDKDIADVSSSNGFEIDNNNDSPSNTNGPRTRPFFSNMTVIGPYATTGTVVNPLFQRGGHLRRNMQACIYNSLIMGWRVGIRFDGANVCNDANSGTVQLRTNIFSGNLTLADQTGGTVTPNPTSFINTWNTSYTNNSDVMLNNPFNIYPDPAGNDLNYWMPMGGSPAASGADFTNPNLAGFQSVSYRGAFGTSGNWTANWAVFNPNAYTIPVPSDFNITVIPEAFLNTSTNQLNSSDTVTVYLRQTSNPFNIVDQAKAVLNVTNYTGTFIFNNAPSGTYYLQVKHRNSIETWSKSGGQPFTQGSVNSYNFTSSAAQAFGSNQILRAGKYCMYSGDVDQDGLVELNDASITENDIFNFAAGYIRSDVNGDGIVDLDDASFIDNNGLNFISVIRP